MRTPRTTSALLAGTAAAALLLSACGSDAQPAPAAAPAAPASSGAAPAPDPSSESPSTGRSPSASTSPTPSGGATVADDRAELDVEDQRGDGRSVDVEEVRLTTAGSGFVAVYTRDGRLLGSAEAGRDRTLTVELDDPIPATGEYRAVLFADDGDGTFDAEDDLRVVEADDDDEDDDEDAVDDEFDYRLS